MYYVRRLDYAAARFLFALRVEFNVRIIDRFTFLIGKENRSRKDFGSMTAQETINPRPVGQRTMSYLYIGNNNGFSCN